MTLHELYYAPPNLNLKDIFPSGGVNIDITVPDENIKFFFFGCWNEDLCVTRRIISDIKKKNFNFGIVNGDNFYPTQIENIHKREKEKNPKLFDRTKVIEGFNVLKSFGKDIYMTLGNHEVDSDIKCKILWEENYETKNVQPTSTINIPSNYYSINVTNNTGTQKLKILMLDTNLLEENKCYNEGERQIEASEMISWLRNSVNDSDNATIIVVGHYPLFFYKKGRFSIEKTMKEIYDILKLSQKQIYYLAADVHNYQDLESYNIRQIISGTGGAHLDDINGFTSGVHTINFEDQNIIINAHVASSNYGYIDIDIDKSGNFVTEYKQITFEGGSLDNFYKRKYEKYIMKINRLKL